ncbi:MAG: DUF3795 domain-containing protein [Candidatus Bathyarchaeota archaeon]|nr:DUF3795 domain-containing protein [Candidatus Bathyarchaeota archaeon A05DMB-5]MDH7557794.1 DUF3795 domain-containing protein [Candidatus Bathyarchaeota archaeon]
MARVIKKTIYPLTYHALNMIDKNSLRFVTYCGLYCRLCAQHARITRQASQLQQTLQEEGYGDFYQHFPEMKNAFPQFSQFLEKLAKFDCTCRSGKGGPSNCEIRKCARQRRITVCPRCREYPCQHIQKLAECYPTLIQDGKRLQKIGVHKWMEEQEQRVKRGISYSDWKAK